MIDDNDDSNESTAELLACFDYDVRMARDAESGLKQAGEFEPQLILSDIGLPGMDGYQLLPLLRQATMGRKVAIVAVTGFGYASDLARSREAGFDAHLTKPIEAKTLLDFVAEQVATY